MRRLMQFARAMRSRGFRCHAGLFVLKREFDGRQAYSAVKVTASSIMDSVVPVETIADYWAARADHRLDKLAAA